MLSKRNRVNTTRSFDRSRNIADGIRNAPFMDKSDWSAGLVLVLSGIPMITCERADSDRIEDAS